MKKFALLDREDNVVRVESFETEAPQLAPEKGLRWVPWIDAPEPTANPLERVRRTGITSDGKGVYRHEYAIEVLEGDDHAAAIAQLKQRRNQAINQQRHAANTSTFDYAGTPIACDALSRSDIDGIAGYIALFNSFPPGWPGVWKAADNTYVPMATIAEFRAMYAAMAEAGLANFKAAQEKKAALAAATSLDDIDAIDT